MSEPFGICPRRCAQQGMPWGECYECLRPRPAGAERERDEGRPTVAVMREAVPELLGASRALVERELLGLGRVGVACVARGVFIANALWLVVETVWH